MRPERDLFANFERMRREMDELFGDVLDRTGLAASRRGGFSPAVDVFYETPPGAGRWPSCTPSSRGSTPTRSGSRSKVASSSSPGNRRAPGEAEDRVYQQLEIDFGPFRRVIPLGAEVVADAAAGDLP